jgi:hypothetical protein
VERLSYVLAAARQDAAREDAGFGIGARCHREATIASPRAP